MIEFKFVPEFDVPNDRTTVTIKCEDNDMMGDHITVYASSVMGKGWGYGNCWYKGVEANKHEIFCHHIGEMKAGSLN